MSDNPSKVETAVIERVSMEECVVAAALADLPESQLLALQKKFRCKRDLYTYLDSRRKCFRPDGVQTKRSRMELLLH